MSEFPHDSVELHNLTSRQLLATTIIVFNNNAKNVELHNFISRQLLATTVTVFNNNVKSYTVSEFNNITFSLYNNMFTIDGDDISRTRMNS